MPINTKESEYGSTALMFAAENGYTETVQALLAAGAEVNAKTDTGTTALMLAVQNGHTQIEALLQVK